MVMGLRAPTLIVVIGLWSSLLTQAIFAQSPFALTPFVQSPTESAVVPAPQAAEGETADQSATSSPLPVPVTPQTGQITREELADLKTRIDASTDLTPELKKQASDLVAQALATMDVADKLESTRDAFLKQAQPEAIEASRKAVEEQLTALRQSREEPVATADLAQLEQEYVRKQQELLTAQASLKQIETQIEEEDGRVRAIREQLTLIPQQVETLNQNLARQPAAEPALVAEARRATLLAERRRLKVEPDALQAEASFIAAQNAVNLLEQTRQLLTTRVNRLRDHVNDWKRVVDLRKKQDAEGRALSAQADTAVADVPELKAVFEQNIALAKSELEIREKLKSRQGQLTTVTRSIDTLTEEKKELENREKRIGTSTSFGLRLREQLRDLPNPATLRQTIRDRTMEYVDVNIEYLEWRKRFQELDMVDDEVQAALASVASSSEESDEEIVFLATGFRKAFEQQRDYLDLLLQAYDDYISALDELNAEQEALAQLSNSFRAYINQRILWVPSHSALTQKTLLDVQEGATRFLSPNYWREVTRTLSNDFQRRSLLYALMALTLTTLLATRVQQKKKIRSLGQKASSRLNTEMAPTWGALFWTAIKSLILPVTFLFVGWRLRHEQIVLAVFHLGTGLVILGVWFFWLEFMRNCCRPYGLGPSHFQWPERANKVVLRQLTLLLLFSIPVLTFVIILRSQIGENESDALERIVGILFLLFLAYTLNRVMSRKTGILSEWKQDQTNGWINLLGMLWSLMAVALPVILAGLTVAGYTYAAEQLTLKLALTLMVLAGGVFVRSLLLRWLTLRQRRLGIEQAREIRAALERAKADHAPTAAIDVLEAQEARTNLADVSTQTRRLLNTTLAVGGLIGVWLIWVDVLPALKYFDRWELLGRVTFSALASAFLLTVLTFTAARNVPGLLEITLLERLPLDRSSRYAIGALTRYVIVIVGILAISRPLKIEWGDVQWLAAALTFGLGFGLQEIFANFISGLIILFEQPVRVGDVVTLDNITGTVTRIRMRSTTITNWDRKDYVVPNKEFITGKLLNWTLTDTTNRITLSVGAAFGSDPIRVREILMESVLAQEHIMPEPKPTVIFEGYTDGAYNFSIYAFLPNLDNRQATLHAINARIHDAFRAEGIERPFAQRELHLHADPTLFAALTNGKAHSGEDEEKEEDEDTPATLIPTKNPMRA